MTPVIPNFVPDSPAYNEKTQRLKTLKTNFSETSDLALRLKKRIFPEILDATVVRTIDAETPTAAFIGFKPRPDLTVPVINHTEERNEAARKDILARTLAGETLEDVSSDQEQCQKAQRQLAAYEDAITDLSKEIEKERMLLAREYCKKLRPNHNDLMIRLSKQMLEIHGTLSEAYAGKTHLVDSEVGLNGLYLNLPEFFSHPKNAHGPLADWFRSVQQAGFIKAVPQELRL